MTKLQFLLGGFLLSVSLLAAAHACTPPKSHFKNVSCTATSDVFLAVKDNGSPVALLNKQGGKLTDLFEYQAVLSSEFKNGLLPVQKNNKVGYINRNGKVVIKPEYEPLAGSRWAAGLSDGRIIARKNGRYHLLDQTGKSVAVLDRGVTQVSDFVQGVALVQQGNQQYQINKQGQKIDRNHKASAIPPAVVPINNPLSINTPQSSVSVTSQTLVHNKAAAMPATNNIAQQNAINTALATTTVSTTSAKNSPPFYPTQQHGKWGFSDQNGVDMIVHVFDEVKNFKEDLAAVRQGDFWGFITPAGDLTIAFRFHKDGFVYQNARPSTPSTPLQFENGKAWIGNLANGEKMCIDTKGNNVACQ